MKDIKIKIFVVMLAIILIAPLNISINKAQGNIINDDNEKSHKPIICPIITYPSLIFLEIGNVSKLSSPIPPGNSVAIPLKVGYSISIPDWIRNIKILGNLFLFRKFISPRQQINIECEHVPDYADIYLCPNQISIDIPIKEEISETIIYMIIEVGENAKSLPYSTSIKASCEDIGRIKGVEFHGTVTFQVGYIPCLCIDSPQYKTCIRNQSTIIPINITNCGNWGTLVNGSIIECPDEFELNFYISSAYVEIDETYQFYLEIIPHEFVGDKVIHLNFKAERCPPSSPSNSANYTHYLVVNVV